MNNYEYFVVIVGGLREWATSHGITVSYIGLACNPVRVYVGVLATPEEIAEAGGGDMDLPEVPVCLYSDLPASQRARK